METLPLPPPWVRLAQLLAAFGDQLRELEEWQNAAREGDRAALHAELQRVERLAQVDLAYVIFIDFLALGVLGFCFLLLSNVQFLVLVNLPPGLATRVGYRRRLCRLEIPPA